jgi:hypothetical protein
MTSTFNKGRSTITLGDGWTAHAEQLPGIKMLGVLHSAHAGQAGLGVTENGNYVAIQGRYITDLVNRKIEAALSEAVNADKV